MVSHSVPEEDVLAAMKIMEAADMSINKIRSKFSLSKFIVTIKMIKNKQVKIS